MANAVMDVDRDKLIIMMIVCAVLVVVVVVAVDVGVIAMVVRVVGAAEVLVRADFHLCWCVMV